MERDQLKILKMASRSTAFSSCTSSERPHQDDFLFCEYDIASQQLLLFNEIYPEPANSDAYQPRPLHASVYPEPFKILNDTEHAYSSSHGKKAEIGQLLSFRSVMVSVLGNPVVAHPHDSAFVIRIWDFPHCASIPPRISESWNRKTRSYSIEINDCDRPSSILNGVSTDMTLEATLQNFSNLKSKSNIVAEFSLFASMDEQDNIYKEIVSKYLKPIESSLFSVKPDSDIQQNLGNYSYIPLGLERYHYNIHPTEHPFAYSTTLQSPTFHSAYKTSSYLSQFQSIVQKLTKIKSAVRKSGVAAAVAEQKPNIHVSRKKKTT